MTDDGDQRIISFGSLTLAGQSFPGGSWVLAEKHGNETTSFIVMNDAEAAALCDQMTERLSAVES